LSGRGLCDELITRPEESYRLCCVVVCDLETSRIGAPYIYDISHLRVNNLTLILLTWRKWWANNASKYQMGFNSGLKGLNILYPLDMAVWTEPRAICTAIHSNMKGRSYRKFFKRRRVFGNLVLRSNSVLGLFFFCMCFLNPAGFFG